MKALTVRQPWASLIAQGKKTVELRTWATKYRGPLLITVSAKKHGDHPTGCTLCLVNLVDCRPATRSDARAACCNPAQDEYAWLLADATPLQQLPIKGRLSTWTPPPALLQALNLYQQGRIIDG